MTISVSKSKLKARMLEYFRQVERTGQPLTVTSHGRPVLRVVAIEESRDPADVFADLRGRVVLPTDDELNAPLPADVFADSDLADLLR